MWYPNKVVSTWIWFCPQSSEGGWSFMWAGGGGGIHHLYLRGELSPLYVWGVWVYRVYLCSTSFGCFMSVWSIHVCSSTLYFPLNVSCFCLCLVFSSSFSQSFFSFLSLSLSISLSLSLSPSFFQRILGNSCLNLYMIGIATKDHQIAEPKPKNLLLPPQSAC